MKNFRTIIIFFLLLIFSCVSPSRVVREDVLLKTKTYVGKYVEMAQFNETYVNVVTTMGIFTLKELPEIPESSWCYVRIEPCKWDMHPDVAYELSPKYFTWNGAEKEYLVYNDIKRVFK